MIVYCLEKKPHHNFILLAMSIEHACLGEVRGGCINGSCVLKQRLTCFFVNLRDITKQEISSDVWSCKGARKLKTLSSLLCRDDPREKI
jgi:hypothetical protein